MKTEWKLFLYLGIFMLPLGIVYLLTSNEPAGSVMILVVAVAFSFIGVYLFIQSRRIGGLRPEDHDGDFEEGQGDVGTFPSASIWPFVAATGLTVMAWGFVFSTFLVLPGAAMLGVSVIGMARESDLGDLGHTTIEEHTDPNAIATPDFSDQVKK